MMNHEILGIELNVAHWKLPTQKEQDEPHEIGVMNVENYHGCIIMSKLDLLIAEYIGGDDKKGKVEVYNTTRQCSNESIAKERKL